MFNIPKNRNLYHWFQKKSINAENLNKYLELKPDTNRNVGALPYDWIKSFPKQERASVTQQVQDILSEFARITDWLQGEGKFKGWAKIDPADFLLDHEFILKELKKILKRDDIKISYAGSGAIKNCQRLDVGDYSYALSGFRSERACKWGFGDYFQRGHGRGYEPQNAITAYKRGAHGRFAKPFTVKVSANEERGGFILSKFVDKQSKAPIGKMQQSRGYFVNLDPSGDTINNINTDIGGCMVNLRHILNKNTRNTWTYFAKMFDTNMERLSNPVATKVQKYLMTEKQKGTDILSLDFINNMKLNKEERDFAVKFIRSLKKSRVQKENPIKSGKYEEVKKLLQEDINTMFTDRINQNEKLEDIKKHFESYPALFAEELGLSNVPVLENWVDLYRDCGKEFDINLKNYFSKKDVVAFFDKNYDFCRNNDALINRFKKDYKIEKELEKFEKRYAQSDLGQSETSWDSFLEFMNRNNK